MKYLILTLFITSCAQMQAITPESAIVSSSDLSKAETGAAKITLDNFKSKVFAITDVSKCAKYSWKKRGTTYKSYYRGMALTYAKAYCHPNDIVSAKRNTPESQYDPTDVLSWYNSNYNKLGMTNDLSGLETQRHVWALLFGLGMRESSGRYCTGRDMSANYATADSAEAGIFQASYGSRARSSELSDLYNKYKKDQSGCYLDVFKVGYSCSSDDLKNWGSGDGVGWQNLAKQCPAFAAEWAAILVRKSGGKKGEFGPLQRKEAELNPDCDMMLKTVDVLIESNKDVCNLF